MWPHRDDYVIFHKICAMMRLVRPGSVFGMRLQRLQSLFIRSKNTPATDGIQEAYFVDFILALYPGTPSQQVTSHFLCGEFNDLVSVQLDVLYRQYQQASQ
jgi:hypothetical protein